VLDAAKRVRPVLSAAESGRLIEEGVATGGMQAKLNAAMAALAGGVAAVRIAPGAEERVLDRLLEGGELGTRIVQS
jgi:acetylglutamate kinase